MCSRCCAVSACLEAGTTHGCLNSLSTSPRQLVPQTTSDPQLRNTALTLLLASSTHDYAGESFQASIEFSTMDWTGGVRRRFAPGKNNAMIQKQKAHFAKARSAARSTPKANIPFKPAFQAEIASSRRGGSINRQSGKRTPDHYRTPREPEVSKFSLSRRGERTSLHKSQRQMDTKDEIIHITSSSVPSTTSSQPGEDTEVADNVEQTHAGEPTGKEVSEEQMLLLANRRRLLARSDWLGLSTTRPVHMKFRSSHDKDRIGKRRKVANSTSQRGRPATRRLITPLFEERQLHPEHMMSGALQSDEVRVKIGTDALASQTQRSRHSQTPRLRTGRKASTDLGPLSEEPMLLGDVGDDFEMIRLPMMPGSHQETNELKQGLPSADGSVSSRGYASAYPENTVPEGPQIHHTPEVAQMTRVWSSGKYYGQSSTFGTDVANADDREDDEEGSAESECGRKLKSPPFIRSDAEEIAQHHPKPLLDQAAEALPSGDEGEGDDEAFWRRLMRFGETSTTNLSVEALRSSSLHATASTSSHRPVLRMRSPEASIVPSTPIGVGTQGSILHGNADGTMAEESADLQSPSASLLAIQRLTEQPAHPPPQREEEADDDAAWRDFIIGSQSSSESSLRYQADHQSQPAVPSQTEEEVNTSAFDISGLGTSVESVGGFTQHARSQNIHSLMHGLRSSTTQRIPPRQQGLSMPQRQGLDNSTAASVDTDGIETDDIEESQPVDAQRSKLVQPARSSILNPKRFKSTKRPFERVSSDAANVGGGKGKAPRRTTKRAKDKRYSVYDLVDSDWASLA